MEQDSRAHPRRLDLPEAALAQEIADELDHLVAQFEVALHALAPQVHVAVLQAHHLINLGLLVDGEGRRVGRIEHRHLIGEHFDLTGRQRGILQAFRPFAHLARNPQHPFVAHVDRRLVGCGGELGIGDHLHDARPVAQVEECHPAVVPAAVHPASQLDLLAGMLEAQRATIMRLVHRASCGYNEIAARCIDLGRR